MTEPLTVTGSVLAGGSAGVTLAAFFPDATPAVVLCALAGAALYIFTDEGHKLWKQVIFAVVSFIGGIFSARLASEILAAVINAAIHRIAPEVTISVTPEIGALFSSTVLVTILVRILTKYKTDKPRSSGEGGQ